MSRVGGGSGGGAQVAARRKLPQRRERLRPPARLQRAAARRPQDSLQRGDVAPARHPASAVRPRDGAGSVGAARTQAPRQHVA